MVATTDELLAHRSADLMAGPTAGSTDALKAARMVVQLVDSPVEYSVGLLADKLGDLMADPPDVTLAGPMVHPLVGPKGASKVCRSVDRWALIKVVTKVVTTVGL